MEPEADKPAEAAGAAEPPMVKPRTWPAYVVLALCGAPIFIIAARKIVHETPMESLVIELDAEGNATLTAYRRWTSETRTGLGLPQDRRRILETMCDYIGQARWNSNPRRLLCPVRIGASPDAAADAVCCIIKSMIWNTHFWEVALESGADSLRLPLPQEEKLLGVDKPCQPRAAVLTEMRLRRGALPELVRTLQFVDVVSVTDGMLIGGYRTGTLKKKDGVWCGKDGRAIILDLEFAGLGVLRGDDWHALRKIAEKHETGNRVQAGETDFSGIDGVVLRLDPDARAGDLVRALAFLTSREGLKVYIVWPEREGDEDWWIAP
ncbi:MAG: hypothetical protein ACYTKD_27675 [Planctomycetota bacterium]|jgi:hypothetical protein